MSRRAFFHAVLAAVAALVVAAPAVAADLDRLRANGVIAERYDGLLELRKSGDAGAKQLVQKVNERRRELYRKRAESQGVSVEQVGKVYAQQILEDAPKGTYFLKPDGSYVRK